MTQLTATRPPTKASALAPVVGADAGNAQYLTFVLGGEMFAVGILNVKEIIEYGNLTEIPMMPVFIRGVINLRGAVVPVIDLAARFGGKISANGKRTCIVILELRDGELARDIGVVVDAVSEVLEIAAGEIEPPPSFGARIRADFIAGMGKVAGRFVVLLDITRVLSVDEITLLADIPGSDARNLGHAEAGTNFAERGEAGWPIR